MKTNSLKLLIAFFVLAGFAQAQGQHQPPDPARMVEHRVSFLTDKLGLSPAQQQQATTIFTNEITAGRSLHGQMKSVHQALSEAVRNNDSAGIDQAAGAIGNLTTQMISGHAKAEAAFVQTLTPDQQSKYAEIGGRWPGMHGFHGRVGPGGPEGPHPF